MVNPQKVLSRAIQPKSTTRMSTAYPGMLVQEGEVSAISSIPSSPTYSFSPKHKEPLSPVFETWTKSSNRLLMHLGFASAVTVGVCSAQAESQVIGEESVQIEYAPKIQFGTSMTPHPEKAHKGGEDACFVNSEGVFGFGVADGVGGWASLGVDPSKYSRAIMSFCKEELKHHKTIDPVTVLTRAEQQVRALKLEGSSTALVCTIENYKLRIAFIGDSGLVVFRPTDGAGRLDKVYRSEDQLHGFNFPFQLGLSSTDSPAQSVTGEVELRTGDVIVAATDGVFDNLFDFEIAQIIEDNLDVSSQQLSDLIAARAFEQSQKTNVLTPFGRKAEESMRFWMGGKEDDVTVVVVRIV